MRTYNARLYYYCIVFILFVIRSRYTHRGTILGVTATTIIHQRGVSLECMRVMTPSLYFTLVFINTLYNNVWMYNKLAPGDAAVCTIIYYTIYTCVVAYQIIVYFNITRMVQ